jgi:uncharacterized protein
MAQTALITGASSGIGLELARIFAKDGYHTVLVARSGDKLQQLESELRKYGVEVRSITADLSRMDEVEKVYRQLQEENIAIDYLVNNAGFGEYGPFHQTAWAKEAMMIDLNVKSLTYMTKLFLDDMLPRRSGRILNVASTAAFQPGPNMAVYFATKAFVLSFSEAISSELEGTGITVTALCPGLTDTGFIQAANMEGSRLVKGRKMPSSAEVARYGYEALMKGKVVAIHGWLNKIAAASVRFAPRSLVRKAVRKIQENQE